MSAQTTPNKLVTQITGNLMKKNANLLGCPPGKWLLVFIDDLLIHYLSLSLLLSNNNYMAYSTWAEPPPPLRSLGVCSVNNANILLDSFGDKNDATRVAK